VLSYAQEREAGETLPFFVYEGGGVYRLCMSAQAHRVGHIRGPTHMGPYRDPPPQRGTQFGGWHPVYHPIEGPHKEVLIWGGVVVAAGPP
jgi:hypothetical protein